MSEINKLSYNDSDGNWWLNGGDVNGVGCDDFDVSAREGLI